VQLSTALNTTIHSAITKTPPPSSILGRFSNRKRQNPSKQEDEGARRQFQERQPAVFSRGGGFQCARALKEYNNPERQTKTGLYRRPRLEDARSRGRRLFPTSGATSQPISLFKFIQRGEIKCHIYLGNLRGFSLPQHDADNDNGDDGGGNTTINWLKDWRRDGGGNEDGNGMSLPTLSSSSS
jgi:hypothetical protein